MWSGLAGAWQSWLRELLILLLLPVTLVLRPKALWARIVRGVLLVLLVGLCIRYYHTYLALPWRRACVPGSEGSWGIGNAFYFLISFCCPWLNVCLTSIRRDYGRGPLLALLNQLLQARADLLDPQ